MHGHKMKKILEFIKSGFRKETQAIIICLVFLVMLFGISVASMVNPVKAYSENENRYLVQKPEFSVETLINGKYTADYEEFITDQFVERDRWIGIKTITELAVLKQDINGVFIGKDGYLIEKHNDNDMDKEQLAKNQERLTKFITEYGEELGEDRVKVLIVPTASDILTDKLPPFAPGFDQDKMMDEMKNDINNKGSYFVDLRDTLKEHNDEYIYYKTDHHWTSLGAYYSYVEWAKSCGIEPLSQDEFKIEKVTDEFLGTVFSKVNRKVEPDSIYLYNPIKDMDYKLIYNQGEKETDTLYDREKLKEKDKYSVFMGGNNAVVQVDTNHKNGRRLLVIKDSFAHSMVPFSVNHFEKTFMVDFRYFKAGISQYIEENKITDILVLYNTINFAKDKNLGPLTK